MFAEGYERQVPYFTGIDSVRFGNLLLPDQVRIVAEIVKSRRTIAKCEARLMETELVVEGIDVCIG